MSFNYENYPGMVSEGFLWFKDLSAPDPLGIVPVVGSMVTLLNILQSQTGNATPFMRRIRRYFFIMPILTIPIWMTFPVAFNMYWILSSGIQLIIMTLVRSRKFRQMLGVPLYLPGSKLERLNRLK